MHVRNDKNNGNGNHAQKCLHDTDIIQNGNCTCNGKYNHKNNLLPIIDKKKELSSVKRENSIQCLIKSP